MGHSALPSPESLRTSPQTAISSPVTPSSDPYRGRREQSRLKSGSPSAPISDLYRDRRPREERLRSGNGSSSFSGSGDHPLVLLPFKGYSSPLPPASSTMSPFKSYSSPLQYPYTVAPLTCMSGGGVNVITSTSPKPLPGTYTSTLPHTIPRLQQDEEVENQHTPWLVPALSMVHLLAFILVMSHNNCERDINGDQDCVVSFLKRFSFESLMENPLLGPSATSLLDLGALESEMVTKAGEAWRLVTSMWLYAGLFHLVVNFTGLFLIGLRLERRFGFLKVGLIYSMTGATGSLVSALFVHGRVSVGASGALMGLVGASASEIVVNWEAHQQRTRSLAYIIIFVFVSLMFGLMPLVDNFTHVGAMITGFLLGSVLLSRPQFSWVNQQCFPAVIYDVDDLPIKPKHSACQNVLWILSLNILVAGYVAAFFALFTVVKDSPGEMGTYGWIVPTTTHETGPLSPPGLLVTRNSSGYASEAASEMHNVMRFDISMTAETYQRTCLDIEIDVQQSQQDIMEIIDSRNIHAKPASDVDKGCRIYSSKEREVLDASNVRDQYRPHGQLGSHV